MFPDALQQRILRVLRTRSLTFDELLGALPTISEDDVTRALRELIDMNRIAMRTTTVAERIAEQIAESQES